MENLKALVFGKETTPYQKALALREFKDITERLELLEKVVNENCNLQNVTMRSEQLKGDYTLKFIEWKNKYFIYEQKTYDYKSINKRDEYTLRDLHRMYRRAMLESPFN